MNVKHASLTAGTVAAVAVAIAVPGLTNAQSGTSITVQEKVQNVATDDIKPKSKSGKVSVGDRLVSRQP